MLCSSGDLHVAAGQPGRAAAAGKRHAVPDAGQQTAAAQRMVDQQTIPQAHVHTQLRVAAQVHTWVLGAEEDAPSSPPPAPPFFFFFFLLPSAAAPPAAGSAQPAACWHSDSVPAHTPGRGKRAGGWQSWGVFRGEGQPHGLANNDWR